MDRTVLPGNDFYAYANGAGAKATAIPADKSNYGMFTELADLSQQRTRDILEAAKSDPNSKIGRAYTAYLDAGAVEAKGLAPIEPWLTKVRSVRSEEHTSELQSLMRISYAVFCLNKKKKTTHTTTT